MKHLLVLLALLFAKLLLACECSEVTPFLEAIDKRSVVVEATLLDRKSFEDRQEAILEVHHWIMNGLKRQKTSRITIRQSSPCEEMVYEDGRYILLIHPSEDVDHQWSLKTCEENRLKVNGEWVEGVFSSPVLDPGGAMTSIVPHNWLVQAIPSIVKDAQWYGGAFPCYPLTFDDSALPEVTYWSTPDLCTAGGRQVPGRKLWIKNSGEDLLLAGDSAFTIGAQQYSKLPMSLERIGPDQWYGQHYFYFRDSVFIETDYLPIHPGKWYCGNPLPSDLAPNDTYVLWTLKTVTDSTFTLTKSFYDDGTVHREEMVYDIELSPGMWDWSDEYMLGNDNIYPSLFMLDKHYMFLTPFSTGEQYDRRR